MNFFETFPESSLLSTVSKKTIKMIGHHSRLRDMMGQSYPIYACTSAYHACTSAYHVHFAVARNILNLRWLKTVSSIFQDIDFDGSLLRAIVRENRADLTDRGRPISSIFWPFNTFHQ